MARTGKRQQKTGRKGRPRLDIGQPDPFEDLATLTNGAACVRSRIRIKNLFPERYAETNRKSVKRVQAWRRDNKTKTKKQRGAHRAADAQTRRDLIIEHDISVLAAPKPNTDTDMNNNTTSQNETAQAEVVRTDEQQERPVVIGTITVVKTDDPIKTEPQDPDYDEARQRSTDGSSTQACAKCKRLKRKLNDKQDELEAALDKIKSLKHDLREVGGYMSDDSVDLFSSSDDHDA